MTSDMWDGEKERQKKDKRKTGNKDVSWGDPFATLS